MQEAGRALFTPSFSMDGIEFAGGLDPLLIAEMLRWNGVEPTREVLAEFRRE